MFVRKAELLIKLPNCAPKKLRAQCAAQPARNAAADGGSANLHLDRESRKISTPRVITFPSTRREPPQRQCAHGTPSSRLRDAVIAVRDLDRGVA